MYNQLSLKDLVQKRLCRWLPSSSFTELAGVPHSSGAFVSHCTELFVNHHALAVHI